MNLKEQGRWVEAAQEWLVTPRPHGVKNFLPSLIELSGTRFQHEVAQSIHAGWDARNSIVQEITNL